MIVDFGDSLQAAGKRWEGFQFIPDLVDNLVSHAVEISLHNRWEKEDACQAILDLVISDAVSEACGFDKDSPQASPRPPSEVGFREEGISEVDSPSGKGNFYFARILILAVKFYLLSKIYPRLCLCHLNH